MVKKFFFPVLFFVIYSQSVISMEVDYDDFFKLCCGVNCRATTAFRDENPTLDINHKYDCENIVRDRKGEPQLIQTTVFLYQASLAEWRNVWRLLDRYKNANIMLADSYGQTLFSYAVHYDYYLTGQFKSMLQKYSLDQINILCKTMPLHKNDRYRALDSSRVQFMAAVLERKTNVDDLDNKNPKFRTALHNACELRVIPYIIQLLKCGASLDMYEGHKWIQTPYAELEKHKASLFVVREAFNSGPPCAPVALLQALEEFKKENGDVANYIGQLYYQVALLEDFSPKARIWEPVCVEACKIAGIEETNKDRCIAKILFMPQEQLTQVNKELALLDK